MPSGVYPRTAWHRKINSEAKKRLYRDNPEVARRISVSVMHTNHIKKIREVD